MPRVRERERAPFRILENAARYHCFAATYTSVCVIGSELLRQGNVPIEGHHQSVDVGVELRDRQLTLWMSNAPSAAREEGIDSFLSHVSSQRKDLPNVRPAKTGGAVVLADQSREQ